MVPVSFCLIEFLLERERAVVQNCKIRKQDHLLQKIGNGDMQEKALTCVFRGTINIEMYGK